MRTSTREDYEVGDLVEWEEDDIRYVGTVSVVLSAQLLVRTREQKDKFVMLKNRSLKHKTGEQKQ